MLKLLEEMEEMIILTLKDSNISLKLAKIS